MRVVSRSLSFCAAAAVLAGCASTTAPRPAAHIETSAVADSGSTSLTPLEPSSPGSGCAEPHVRRTADAYLAMLATQQLTDRRVFVSARYSNGDGMTNSDTGAIDHAALVCLQQQAPQVVVVSGPDDPALPTATGSGIRRLPEGPLITFGQLDGDGDHTTSINIDNGGGDVRGAEFAVQTDASGHVTVEQTGSAWIS